MGGSHRRATTGATPADPAPVAPTFSSSELSAGEAAAPIATLGDVRVQAGDRRTDFSDNAAHEGDDLPKAGAESAVVAPRKRSYFVGGALRTGYALPALAAGTVGATGVLTQLAGDRIAKHSRDLRLS